VASRSATDAAVRAVPGNMNAIGHRLSVGAALEGKIRRSVGRMRLTVTLTNINSGRILWNETYDREVKDAFAVQDEVARAVASALRVKLNGANQVLASHSTTNSEAHDLYLRGRFMQAKYTEVALNKSLELFQKALEKDSSYALAWAGIGDSWGALADDYVAPKIAYPKLREAALRGLAIDSTLPELKYTYGMGTWEIDHDFRGALRRVELAMRNDRVAGAVDGVYLYSVGLWELGLRDSAAVMMRQSVERDPANPGVLMSAFQYERHARDTVGARATCERLKELSAGARCAAELRLMEGSGDAGLSYFRGTVTDADPRTVMGARRGMVEALVKLGRVAEARAIVAQADAEARRGPRYVREDALAIMWAAVGDNERALQWLRRGVQSNSAGLQVFYLYAHDYPIVRDPRAVAILKSVGVPDPPPYL
jgi:tetratricopeptide (TPR) repeat protein